MRPAKPHVSTVCRALSALSTVRNDAVCVACFACEPSSLSLTVLPLPPLSEPCPNGKYQTFVAQSACVECQPGRANSALSQSACVPCLSGTFSSISGATACTACAVGEWQPSSEKTACLVRPFFRRFLLPLTLHILSARFSNALLAQLRKPRVRPVVCSVWRALIALVSIQLVNPVSPADSARSPAFLNVYVSFICASFSLVSSLVSLFLCLSCRRRFLQVRFLRPVLWLPRPAFLARLHRSEAVQRATLARRTRSPILCSALAIVSRASLRLARTRPNL